MLWLAATAAMALAAWWALRPLEESDLPTLDPPQAEPVMKEEDIDELDPTAFLVDLWTPEAEPDSLLADEEIEEPAERMASPEHLSLIGITETSSGLFAALYDARDSKVLLVRDGDDAHGWTVTAVDSEGVALAQGEADARLALKEGDR